MHNSIKTNLIQRKIKHLFFTLIKIIITISFFLLPYNLAFAKIPGDPNQICSILKEEGFVTQGYLSHTESNGLFNNSDNYNCLASAKIKIDQENYTTMIFYAEGDANNINKINLTANVPRNTLEKEVLKKFEKYSTLLLKTLSINKMKTELMQAIRNNKTIEVEIDKFKINLKEVAMIKYGKNQDISSDLQLAIEGR